MNEALNEQEANRLFNEVSKAMQEDDTSKVSDLLAKEALEEEQPVEELPADEPEVTNDEDKEEDSPQPEEDAGKETDDEPDPLEELRTQLATLQKENQSLRSQAGRVPHVQRKLDEIDKKLKQLTASPSSQTSAKITPKVDELLKDVEDTDPALAKALKGALTTAIEGIDEEQRSREITYLQQLREEETKLHQQHEAQRLLEMYPNAPDVFASPHWAEWKKEQPDHILALAQSDNADAVALAFNLYAKAMQEKYPSAANNAAPEKSNEQANRVQEQRQRKQQTAANLNQSNVVAKDKGPTNPEALFAKFSEEIRKNVTG